MKIAVLSDIHDHLWHLKAALASEPVQACEALICCGDLCAPFIMKALGEGFPGQIHLVFGNNDADTFRITRIALEQFSGRVQLHGELANLALGGQKIAVNHYPEIAQELAASGHFDWVCFGHNHLAEVRLDTVQGRKVRLLNPGALMGMSIGEGGPYRVAHSFAVMDTDHGVAHGWQVSADFGVQPYESKGLIAEGSRPE